MMIAAHSVLAEPPPEMDLTEAPFGSGQRPSATRGALILKDNKARFAATDI